MLATEHPLKAFRAALGYRQEDLSRCLGVGTRTVSSAEAGTAEGTPWKLIEALASKFTLTLDQAKAICDGTISKTDLDTVCKRIRGKRG